MSQSHGRSGPLVKDNGAVSARSASGKPKSNATSFRKGRKKTGGRMAGVPNRTTNLLRDAVILAAEAVGSDGAGKDGLVGYLMRVAIINPLPFCSLLGRVMPLQKSAPEVDHTKIVYRSADEIRQELLDRGVPPILLGPSAEELNEFHEWRWQKEKQQKERNDTEANAATATRTE